MIYLVEIKGEACIRQSKRKNTIAQVTYEELCNFFCSNCQYTIDDCFRYFTAEGLCYTDNFGIDRLTDFAIKNYSNNNKIFGK